MHVFSIYLFIFLFLTWLPVWTWFLCQRSRSLRVLSNILAAHLDRDVWSSSWDLLGCAYLFPLSVLYVSSSFWWYSLFLHFSPPSSSAWGPPQCPIGSPPPVSQSGSRVLTVSALDGAFDCKFMLFLYTSCMLWVLAAYSPDTVLNWFFSYFDFVTFSNY